MEPSDRPAQHIVKAANASSAYIPLTPLDIYLGHFITGGVYFFLRCPDIERMKHALAVALDRHPSFGACMVREADLIGLQCGTTGAGLSICHRDFDGPDFYSAEPLITDALLAADHSDADDAKRDDRPEDYAIRSYTFNSGWPVADFRLIVFRTGRCALLVQHVHSQADGSAAIQFLQNWSRAYRGEPLVGSSGYSRQQIASLATLPGLSPSSRLNILRHTTSQPTPEPTSQPTEDRTSHGPVREGAAIRADLPRSALDHFVNVCRRASRLSLSSSDILHALAWQCFASTQADPAPPCIRIYTLFDLRGVEPLGIPRDYDGSAVLGRRAEMGHAELCRSTIPHLAEAFQQQIKPFTANEAQADISYLAREYNEGHIDEGGNYTNFVIGAWLDCRNPGGLIVNDLRRLGTENICFEDRPARMETLVTNDINMVTIYQNDDGTITFHYVGERKNLIPFTRKLKSIVADAGRVNS